MTDITCRMIVQKGKQYFMADANYHTGTDKYRPVFTQYAYDAMRFMDEKKAHEKAKELGGRVRLFDALNGDFI